MNVMKLLEKYKEFVPTVTLIGIVLLFVGGTYVIDNLKIDSFKMGAESILSKDLPELKELAGTQWEFQKYSTYFQQLADKKGGVYAYRVLLEAPFPKGTDLHLLGHVVGDMLYKQKGLSGINSCTPDFRNACSHSIVVGYLRDHGEGALPEIVKTCKEAPGGRGAYTMCFHGLGHGVLAFVGYDLEKAVNLCQKTGTPEFQNREYMECTGGTIMEMIAGVHDRDVWATQKDRFFKKSDPLYPCNAPFMPDEVKSVCYVQLTPHLFEAAGGDLGNLKPSVFAKAMSYCAAIPKTDSMLRNSCYSGFGKEYIVLAQDRDIRDMGASKPEALKTVRDACAKAGDEEGEDACNMSALNSLFWGGENNPDASFSYCEIASGEAKDQCYRNLAGNINFYLSGNPKSKALCERLPSEYKSSCSKSLR